MFVYVFRVFQVPPPSSHDYRIVRKTGVLGGGSKTPKKPQKSGKNPKKRKKTLILGGFLAFFRPFLTLFASFPLGPKNVR